MQSKEKAKEKVRVTTTKSQAADADKRDLLADIYSTGEEVYYKNGDLKKAITIVERMANQNTFDDISQDYKYWEDVSDEFKEGKSTCWKLPQNKFHRPHTFIISWNSSTLVALLLREGEAQICYLDVLESEV